MGRCDTEGLSSILCVFCTCQERLGKWAVYRAVGPPDLFAGLADLLNTSASLFGLEKTFSSERHHPSLDRDFSFFSRRRKEKSPFFTSPLSRCGWLLLCAVAGQLWKGQKREPNNLSICFSWPSPPVLFVGLHAKHGAHTHAIKRLSFFFFSSHTRSIAESVSVPI